MHELSTGRFIRGMTPIRPSRPCYGTWGRCSCGQKFKVNLAPSKGGQGYIERLHAAHAKEARG